MGEKPLMHATLWQVLWENDFILAYGVLFEFRLANPINPKVKRTKNLHILKM